ncbi:unnamed protein product [Adineta ricciae]|uniref:Uncharacterized protein n=1 Tax=Adineta ricciae TaxID=249248 RepID=A0A814R7U7_ADIRI|nr:unnamed protein product [Adineta ricciae]
MHIHSTFAIFLLFCLLIQTLYGIPPTHYRAEQDDQQLASLINELKERQWHIDSSEANDNNIRYGCHVEHVEIASMENHYGSLDMDKTFFFLFLVKMQ